MAHRSAKRETRTTAAHGAPAEGRVAQEKRGSRGAHAKADGLRSRSWQPPQRHRRTLPARYRENEESARRPQGRTAADCAVLDPAAPPHCASRSTPSFPPPPPPARGGAPPRRGRRGPRLPLTPGGKRASRSPRRRRHSANRTTGRPPPVGVTAPVDDDGGRRRRATRAGGQTAADWAALDPARPPQRTEHFATAPPRPSAAPVEARRRCSRRRRQPGAVRPHAEGAAAPNSPHAR